MISNENRIRYLLDRCLANNETEQERAELNSYFFDERLQEDLEKEVLNSFFQPKNLIDMSQERQEQILHAIQHIDKEIPIRRKYGYWKWLSVAAIFLAALVVLIPKMKEEPFKTPVYVTEDNLTEHENTADEYSKSEIVKDREPARDVAIFEATDGSHIELEKLSPGQVFEREGVTMQRLEDGTLQLLFVPDINKSKYANRLNTIKTPRGGTYNIILPDGTLVHLNSASKLSFPTLFNPEQRQVTVEGEAYFNVTKDSAKPFIVHTEKGGYSQDVIVYGTQFNINTYPENDGITTTLVEGSVMVKQNNVSQLLQPLQQAVAKEGFFEIKEADLDINLAWKRNLFYFANESLDNVMKQISRWYDVDILYNGKVPDIKLWGQISRTKKLSEILEILRQTNGVRFQVKGKEVTVME